MYLVVIAEKNYGQVLFARINSEINEERDEVSIDSFSADCIFREYHSAITKAAKLSATKYNSPKDSRLSYEVKLLPLSQFVLTMNKKKLSQLCFTMEEPK